MREEIDYLRAYLSVEQERWGDRLQVVWEVSEDTLELSLPPLTLQPLVENALVHGIGNRLEGGTLSIRTERRNGSLVVCVCDDGPGFPKRYRERTGLGNLRKRLETIYGEEATVRSEGNREGASVTVEIPAQTVARVNP